MTLTADQILSAVEKLDIADREALLSELASKYPRPDQAEFDAACASLAKKRYEELQADPSRGRTLEQVLDAVAQRTKR